MSDPARIKIEVRIRSQYLLDLSPVVFKSTFFVIIYSRDWDCPKVTTISYSLVSRILEPGSVTLPRAAVLSGSLILRRQPLAATLTSLFFSVLLRIIRRIIRQLIIVSHNIGLHVQGGLI